MPNWCANHLEISGSRQNIKNVKKLMKGEIHPFYKQAIQHSIKFFVAACAGIVKPVVAIELGSSIFFGQQEYPLVPCDSNGVNDANSAFTEWFNLLRTDPSLNKEVSERIVSLYQKSGLASFSLASITDKQREIIHSLFKTQSYDWFDCFNYSVDDIEKHWQALDATSEAALNFDMRLVIPPKLIPEIAGFNGALLEKFTPLSSYDAYVQTYGVKWPVGYELVLTELDECSISVDFDTPWSPPSHDVFIALSSQFQCSIEHYYSEPGCGYCGNASYEDGSLLEHFQDDLEYGAKDEDGCCDIVGPSYILNRVAHFGG